MRVTLFLVVGAVVAAASEDNYFARLLKRQQPGTPQYDCHAACGGVITASRTEGFCNNDTFKANFDSCMDCAQVYGIWQYYGTTVSRAAATCNLEINLTPAPASSTSAASPSAPASASSNAVADSASTSASSTSSSLSSVAASSSSATSTSTVPATSTASATSATTGTTTAATSSIATGAANNSTSPTSSSPPVASFTGAAEKIKAKEAAAAVFVGFAAYVLL
ncbi:hypothetical protein C1H76_6761 [Elsinoe australis]|uniref:Uncharacterized protein n=1 Tax=Elsinoe australis TaxID=40998 RepID=A0A4U7AX35_9PEZI|nr:hypothetical protein C1H76_6761 [Elsinoe australis]